MLKETKTSALQSSKKCFNFTWLSANSKAGSKIIKEKNKVDDILLIRSLH